jgi:class 3 adenylate cyclase/tetratricopeptide (TPR) repeat protein
VPACPNCAQENPHPARFCSACGSPLTVAAARAREERKLVSVLFADLVGFTARSEHLDPEDVRAMLSPYYARLRSELERHGGTVEKFIGDAVMAVFGAPVAHEDDPERAVRAALAIRDWVRDDQPDIQVRIAVNTGEALVSLGARTADGEGLVAGDVVNTAARLQTAAPINGILVGERTYRATRAQIDYREAEPVTAKGKTEPVPAWEALEARSRLGVDTVADGAPLVGRERELAILRDALDRAREEDSPQLITLVGVPGMGKSRLVYELSRVADAETDLIMWRQGRSLPYGDGVTYWALGEMIKAHCGILDTDAAEVAAAKLAETARAVIDDESVLAQLRPLVGLGSDVESGREHQAWRRFFEALAAKGPLVLVFEDLHWADDSLLDFIDHLVDWATGVPLLVVCTARPELLDRRPAWGGGKRNASTVSLAALSEQETARLVARLMDRSVIPLHTQEALLARVGGNPLYTEQYVHMLLERGDEEFPLPETVQGLIAARLDGLAAEQKALLQAASVFGKVFWRGAAAAVAEVAEADVDERLHALQRKEFVRRERRSSVADETEYAFGHLLVRDVAYAELPRAARAAKHRAAAEWIESLGRSEDLAEMLAHHYQQALDYARAAGEPPPGLELRVRDALVAAGDRAFALGSLRAAAQYFVAAAELTPRDDPARPRLLLKVGRSRTDDLALEASALEEASAGLLAQGDANAAAEAETRLARIWWAQASSDRARVHLDRAVELVDPDVVSPERAEVLGTIARMSMLAGDLDRAIEIGGEALRLARQLDRVDLEAHAIISLGTAKGAKGDRAGMAELERAVELCGRPGLEYMRSHARSNISSIAFELGDVRSSIEHNLRNLREVETGGDPSSLAWADTERAQLVFFAGDWQEAEERLVRLSAIDSGPPYIRTVLNELRIRLLLARGRVQEALLDARTFEGLAREIGDPQVLYPALGELVETLVEAGQHEDAGIIADELLGLLGSGDTTAGANARVSLAHALLALGRGDELRDVLGPESRWFDAARAMVDQDFSLAADLFDEIGSVPDEARARMAAGERLLATGQTAEAAEQLDRAAAFFRRVGATAYLAQCEALRGRSGAAAAG